MTENIDAKIMPCYLKLTIRGCQTHKSYQVEPETWERLDAILDTPKADEGGYCFFSFDAVDGRAVSISVPDIQMVGYTENCLDKTALEPGFSGIRLYFRDTLMPVSTTLADDMEAFFLESVIASTSREEPFFSFLDGKGEKCSFNLNHLVIIELSAKQVSQGSLEEQLAEQQQTTSQQNY